MLPFEKVEQTSTTSWSTPMWNLSENELPEEVKASAMDKIPTLYIYPPTKEPDLRSLLITLYLIMCLTVGLCGNFSQLTLQYYSFRLRIYNSDSSPNCTQLYLALLHIAYFLISISLPSVIIDNLVQLWMFGLFSCFGHFLLVNAGRTAASWLTVMLFYDQLRVLKKEETTHAQNKRILIRSLIFIGVICLASILPALLHVKVVEEILEEDKNDEIFLRIRTFKCTSKMPPQLTLYSSALNFFLDYALPLFVMFCIACKIEWHTYRNRTMTVIYQRRVQNWRVLVAILFMFGYAPHWLAVSYFHLANTFNIHITDVESQLLADFDLLFQYTLPVIIWWPLSSISEAVAKQARFYDTATTHLESFKEASGVISWSSIGRKLRDKCANYGVNDLPPPINKTTMTENTHFKSDETRSPTSSLNDGKITTRRLLSVDDCYDVNL